ncbi:hypothetical protein IW262DRAFT_1530196 [Armillaria fumosa]|nr:hypothetical protein IW262DRAFT_1530196 [Armillaria fumosa]
MVVYKEVVLGPSTLIIVMMTSHNSGSSFDQQRSEVPIDILPDEILLEIFSFGTDSTQDTSFSFLISIICRSWRSLAINEARLWTSLNVRLEALPDPLPIPTDFPFELSEVFPRETLILERSGDRDLDFYFLGLDDNAEGSEHFTEKHFFLLSCLLSRHAHRLRTFKVSTENWPSIVRLSTQFRGLKMPRLESYDVFALSSIHDAYEDSFDFESVQEAIHIPGYPEADKDFTELPSMLYPSLHSFRCFGVPGNWGLFCPSNLRRLSLQNQPWVSRPSLEDLRRIFTDSKDTLEVLELTFIVRLDESEDVVDPPVPESRLVLPHVRWLELGYTGPSEAQKILRQFDFPSLRGLILQNSQESADSRGVLMDLITFVQLEQLSSLNLYEICVAEVAGLPEDETVAEKSLPVVLQLLLRVSRGNLHALRITKCCEDFYRFLNYGNGLSLEGGSVNLSGLKDLFVQTRGPGSGAVVSFLRERLEQGTINKVYTGPVMESMVLALKDDVQEEVESLGYRQLAKLCRVIFY